MLKRGQVAVFIIIAILIVIAGILIYVFFPQIKTTISGEISPNNYVKDCVEPTIIKGIKTLSAQGGYANPEGYLFYRGQKIKYLCYTSQYYKLCRVQDPTIKNTFEDELERIILTKTDECVSQLKEEYESRGYEVSVDETTVDVGVVPRNIRVRVNAPMSISKESTQTFDEFNFEIASNIYNLLILSASIVQYEASYGRAPQDLYTSLYPNIRITVDNLGDDSTVYILEDVNTKESFSFASRSLPWGAGYNFD